MKKIFYLAAVAIATIFVSSCKDDPVGNLNGQGLGATKDSTVAATDSSSLCDYTFVMLATGGGDVDEYIVTETLMSLEKIEATNGKVRLVGIYKPSMKYQSTLGENGGTRFFELSKKEGITKEKIASDIQTIKNTEEDSIQGLLSDQSFMNDIVNEKYAGVDYKYYTPDNIAAMLKYLTQKAPAKKYILITDDHGAGWQFDDDAPLATTAGTTRAMIKDDCLGNRQISLDVLNEGVKRSGIKFDALFCNLCLMATLENLYGYSENFPICIASDETTTTSYIGNLAERLAKISGDATHDQLFNECSDWATTSDTNTGHRKWLKCSTLQNRNHLECQSMGCYDLTKIGTLTASLTAISNWFTNSMADEQLKKIVEKSVLTTLYCKMPDKEFRSICRDEFIVQIGKYSGYDAMTADQMADQILAGKGKKFWNDIDSVKNNNLNLYTNQQKQMSNGYSMAYFVWNTERIARQNNMTKAAGELSALLNNYTTALKGMCRIKCSFDDFSGITVGGITYPKMDPYLWTSPTVQITSLSAKGFSADYVVDYSTWNRWTTLNKAIASYNNTKFDQQTGWSNFLKHLDQNPCVFTNSFREIPVYYKVFGSLK